MSNVTKSQRQDINAMDKKSTKSVTTDEEKCSSTEIPQVGCGNHGHDQQGSSYEPSSSPDQKDPAVLQEKDRLKSARAEMGHVREENEKLKSLLSQVVKDYQSLQRQYFDVFRQEEADKTKSTNRSPSDNQEKVKEGEGKEEEEEAELALTLGRTSNMSLNNNNNLKDGNENDGQKEVSLGLGCRYEKVESMGKQVMKNDVTNNPVSSDESFEEAKEEEPKAVWPPSKVLKTMKSNDDDDVVLQQPQLKKARVSIRARCDTPTMNDGCQWRKYGQKIAKGNPCPRAYYRCTVSSSCPVRKQVQRCFQDMSILITTYEGNHNHPLPLSATAMASTTSAAASMLQSRSTTSHPGSGLSVATSTSISSSPNSYGMDFNMSTQNAKPHHFFANSTISTCNSHPTITLDLTTPPKCSQFNSTISSNFLPKYSSPCLNFSSSTSSSSFPSNWNQTMQPIDRNHLYQSCATMNGTYAIPSSQQPSLTDTLAAATKALASNPSFQTALAAALTTFAGNGTISSIDNIVQGVNSTLAMNWHGGSSSDNSHPLTSQGNGVACATKYLSKTTSLSSQQQGSVTNLFPPTLSLSTSSKSASTSSPSNNKDHNKIFANSDV